MTAVRSGPEPAGFARAAKVADAVLWEGYVLYPYRASALKNRLRWQFGVLAPAGAGAAQTTYAQTDCLVAPRGAASLTVRVRFLQVHSRDGDRDRDGAGDPAWEEGVLREFDAHATLVPGTQTCSTFEFSGEAGPGRRGRSIGGLVRIETSSTHDTGLLRARIRIENHTVGPAGPRPETLLSSFIGTHALLSVAGGVFLSLADPPPHAAAAAAACQNRNAWPALIDDTTLLSAPIILSDRPAVAPESSADLCDATEIDELLLLRTMTLTDEEKRQARATDARAAAIVDLADGLDRARLERLHGTMRRDAADTAAEHDAAEHDVAGREATDRVQVHGGCATVGATVRLRPRNGADAQDMFLRQRLATVRAIRPDADGRVHLAVTLDDDPAAQLQAETGRYLYFAPEEVELA